MLRFVSPPMPHITLGGEDTYPVGGTHPNRSQIGVFDLLVVTRGGLFLEENGIAHDVPAGHYVILRPDMPHRTRMPCREETHFYWIHFHTVGSWSETEERQPLSAIDDGKPYSPIESFSFYLPAHGSWMSSPGVPELIRRLLPLQDEQSAVSRWKQQQLFHELLLQLQQEAEPPSDSPHYAVAEKAAAFLRDHYREEVGYRRLSEALHFHANYISICMKRTFGCTPLDYLTRHRVEQAKRLLIHTDGKIGGIAEETGFGSFPYFVRCFTRYAGMTPKAFRKQYRQTEPGAERMQTLPEI
ncbi:helix-turn-helix domain-containing protein [Cohnella candidum]|uniref:AraC family transcriptional regulator n=1 Tax=Cohnella candidum TaxID=2674991 RepID=A0A3G3K190_9BACL|nr:AraC family transcriptional regulator [Cohnella candidum]AYQ74314.1 AraC family transcriptional regulator [Cohnella candidum]